jgi:hypothetical protein
MALAGNQARIFINNVDLSAVASTLDVETSTGEYDATVLASTVMEYRPGLNEGSIAVNGFFDGVDNGTEKALYDALGANSKLVAAVLDFSSLPAPAYVCEDASNMGMTWNSPTDGLITINGTFKGKQGLKRGKILHYNVNRSATGILTARQIPGVLTNSTGKMFLVFHKYTGSLTGNLTAAVQSSVNGSTGWANEASFSFATLGAQSAVLTSPLGEYFTINLTSLGGASTVNLSLIVVIDGLT